MSDALEICTTQAGQKRHLSKSLGPDRHAPRMLGRGGRTLCGNTGAMDQTRVNRQVTARQMRPCKDITEMPPCRACYRAAGDAADETFHLTADQLGALHALLGLVHYDALAESWLNLLPAEFRPERGDAP